MTRAAVDTPIIGYISPAIYSSYYRLLLAGVQRAARERGARLLVFQMTVGDIIRSGLSWDRVDGWVACFSDHNSGGFEILARSGRPLVMISQPVSGAPLVVTDNRSGMRGAAEHLLGLGHRRIAFVGWEGNPDIPARIAGYREALESRGVPFDPALVLTAAGGRSEHGADITRRLLSAGMPCSAIAFANDNLALGALRFLREAGVRVPEDLAITGFDDMPEAQIATPPLTTVRMRFDAMSRAAAEHLLDMLGGARPAAEPIVVPMSLVARRSAGERSDRSSAVSGEGLSTHHAALARRLAETVGAPETLAPGDDPRRLWPGVDTIVGAVEAALAGAELPDDAALQGAWASAVQKASYADPLQDALAQIEAALAAASDPAAVGRLRATLLRVCVGGQVERVNRAEAALSFSDAAARRLADLDLEDACGLDWLEQSGVAAAALGLWERGAAAERLSLAGKYPGGGTAAPPALPAEQFPPLEALDAAADAPVSILPLRSARRDWGYLALAFPGDLETAAFDSAPLLAALLTARIDSATLQREREAEQEALRIAYERERALAETVREIGCPVIPLSRTALLVPLIGVIDSQRAELIHTAVLRAAETQRAEVVLLDVTGVPVIDTHVAGLLLQLAQMLRLLGARTTLVGVRPEIAQSIVALGVNLGELDAAASLMGALVSA